MSQHYENAPAFVAILDEAFSRITRDEAVARLKAADIPVNVVQGTSDFLRDPQAVANRCFYRRKATTPPEGSMDGTILISSSPIKYDSIYSGTDNTDLGPQLGVHSIAILKEYGYTKEEIDSLLRQGVVVAG